LRIGAPIEAPKTLRFSLGRSTLAALLKKRLAEVMVLRRY
jgi:hypothetical protein